MDAQFRIIAAVLITLIPTYAVTVTPGIAYVRPVTARTTAGTGDVVISAQPAGEQQFEVGQVIAISGQTGYKIVASYTQVGNPATVSTTLRLLNDDQTPFLASSSASGLSVRLIADYLDHTSVRIWSTTDVNSCASVWFDTASHPTGADYQYRTDESACGSTVQAVDAIGLAPNTRYHFRTNAKTVYGPDNTGACNSDTCGAIDIAITTPPDSHGADGRPPMPALPASVAAQVTSAVDTSAYQVVQVPQFPDGVVTGSISAGSTTLTVNTVPAGMAVNQWIVINGTTCNFGNAPWCKITGISGTTITLDRPSTATVSNAAVSWGVVTIQQLLYDKVKGYGTVFEFKQGYRAKMWPTDWEAGHDGVRIPGLPVDDNPSCSTHPCSIDDPAHRWIVIRTAATPGNLPPFGFRTGPEYAGLLGGIETQGPLGAGFALSEHGNNSMPAHHVRFENLLYVPVATAANAADPNPMGGFVAMHWGEYMPAYVAIDRVYIDVPSVGTRVMGMDFAGKHMAMMNSYLRAEYWRPYVAHYGASTSSAYQEPSVSGSSISVPGYQWQRSKSEPMVTQGSATVTASGIATGTVAVWLVMDGAAGNGMEVRYTSGKGVLVTCSSCRAVNALTDPTPTSTQKWVYYAEVATGSSAFSSARAFNDSVWLTEGPDGINASDGDHWLIQNNHIESYNKGFFVDVPTPKIIRPPEHVTIRRNHFYWNQDHRVTSSVSNGYTYLVRQVGLEFKRGMKILIEGNDFEGGWAGINQGSAILISETAFDAPVNARVEDVTIRYNVFHTVSESFAVNPHYSNGYPQMGADVGRIYYGQNLTYDQNAWEQYTNPGPYFYGKQGLYCGHDIVVEHNTIYNASANYPVINYCGDDHIEGLWLQNNIWHTNVGAYGILGTNRENQGLPPIPDTTFTSVWTGPNYDVVWNAITSRLTGTGTLPTFQFRSNVLICGSRQTGDSGLGRSLVSDVDFTSTECDSQKTRFGSLASQNYFVNGLTKAARTASLGWVNPPYDFHWLSNAPFVGGMTTTDGTPVGVNIDDVIRVGGTISNLAASNVRASGVSGCSGAAGTYCATLSATVPDTGTACRASYGLHGSAEASWTVTALDTSSVVSRSFSIQGVVPGSYDFRIRCAGAPPSVVSGFATSGFTIASSSDLVISKTHGGYLSPGQTGTFTLTVTNVGAGSTIGTVSVMDIIPSGLTATNISGTGWSCTQPAGPCTRSDAIVPGQGFPPITVSVTAAANAPSLIVNTATVTGGGDSNSSNNTATNVVAVLPPGTSGNMVPGNIATQSSTLAGASADRAVDGNTNGNWIAGSITHTAYEANPWWQVDLGSSAVISSVVVWNRTDCCSDRLTDYWVFVSNTPFAASDTPATLAARAGTWSSHQTTAPNPNTAIPVPSVQGRYVRVQLSGTNYLSLAEVQVIGMAALPSLKLVKAHAGVFIQGQSGATYTITVTNTGAAPTSGVVSVAETSPAGLTVGAMSGTGWTCIQTAGPCTRSDSLVPGQSFSDITVSVKVDPTAASSLSNGASVSGGGAPSVSVTDPTTILPLGISNLALGKPADQSGTLANAVASRATDGNTNGAWTANSVTHTDLAANSWWQVDLGSASSINTIVVWNRTDCCGERLSDYWVFVSNNPFLATDTLASVQNRADTWKVHLTSMPNPATVIPVSVSAGRYVRVQLSGTNYLSLAEVQVYGTPGPDLKIAATHAGNFIQGQSGAAYTIRTTNVGAVPTTGSVSVSVSVPPGLTASNIAGANWTCTQPLGPCTRGDSLAVGASYDVITLTVSAAANAGPVVAMIAAVSGGGDINPDNNSAADATSVLAAGATGNLALGRYAEQSSIAGASTADRAVDGNTNGVWAAGSVTHTDLAVNSWWQVDLGASGTISSINVWNRVDCCGDRLSNYWVFVSDTPFAPSDTPLTLATRPQTWSRHQTSAPAPNTAITVPAVTGRYVRVQLDGTGYLSLAEVQVLGVPGPAAPDLVISETHSGYFTQGQSGAAYTITVTNSGSALTGGTVTASTTIPSGISAANIAGAGWTCTQPAGPCTRNDALAPATSYPPLVLTVSVAPNAPSSVVTTASVLGGGESNTANDTATDTATVVVSGALPNLALGKPAYQSGTLSGTPERAIDGNTSGVWADNSTTHTTYGANSWWQVDLGSAVTIGSVIVFNRTDCCGDRLSDYWIFVSNTPFAPWETPATLATRAGTWSSHQATVPSPSATVAVPSVQGRYVRIQLTGSNYLSLAEVRVLAP